MLIHLTIESQPSALEITSCNYSEQTGQNIDELGQLAERVNCFRQAASSNDPKYNHVTYSHLSATPFQYPYFLYDSMCYDHFTYSHLSATPFQVLNECSEAENQLREAQQLQDTLPKHAEPVLLSANAINLLLDSFKVYDLRRTGFIEREEVTCSLCCFQKKKKLQLLS